MALFQPSDIRENFVVGLVAMAVITVILVALGVDVDSRSLAALFIGFMILGWFTRRTADITLGFAIITLSILLIIAEFVIPDPILSPFERLHNIWTAATGVNLSQIDPFAALVIAVVFVGVMIGVRLRITGEKKFIRPIFDQVLREFARYLDLYVTAGRLVILFSFTAVVIVAEQSAQLSGQVGSVIAEAPIVASNILTIIVGFDALGGDLPIIGSIPGVSGLEAAGFLLLAVAILAVAAASRFEGSGPLSQFLNR